MASPGLSKIVTTTLRNGQGKTADKREQGQSAPVLLTEQDGWESARAAPSCRNWIRRRALPVVCRLRHPGYLPQRCDHGSRISVGPGAAVVAANGLEIDARTRAKNRSSTSSRSYRQRRAHHEEPAHLRHVLDGTLQRQDRRRPAAAGGRTNPATEPWAAINRATSAFCASVLPRTGRWWRCITAVKSSLHG